MEVLNTRRRRRILKKGYTSYYHHHHVHECLGVFPVPWSSRWSWSLHLFLGRTTFLRHFGLCGSACFGSLFVSILRTCCSHFFWYCFISFTMFCTPVYTSYELIEDGWRRFAFLHYKCARRMTQICVFNTRFFSLHNTLNYAIHRACLRMVLLTDFYRNLTSHWIKL